MRPFFLVASVTLLYPPGENMYKPLSFTDWCQGVVFHFTIIYIRVLLGMEMARNGVIRTEGRKE